MSETEEGPHTSVVGHDMVSDHAFLEPTAAAAAPARVTTRSKLRDSCQSCAKSKVRCTKEKPTCLRCGARAIQCHYLQSKRPGRIPRSGVRQRSNSDLRTNREKNITDASTNFLSPPPSSSGGGTPDQAGNTADDDMISALLASSSSPTFDADCSFEKVHSRSHSLPDASLHVSDAGLLSATSGIDSHENMPFDWDECLGALSRTDNKFYSGIMDWDPDLDAAKPASLFDSRNSESTASGTTSGTTSRDPQSVSVSPHPTHTISAASSSSSSAIDLVDFSNRTTPLLSLGSNGLQLKSMQIDNLSGFGPNSNANLVCDCMFQALDLLKALSESAMPQAPPIPDHSYIESVLAQNKEDIEISIAILACTLCTDDKFLLMILHLITMKLLGRYESVAGLYSASNTTGSGTEGQLSSRESIQQVLRELHRVQRLITQLSSRLKSFDYRGPNGGSTIGLFESQFLQNRNRKSSHDRTPMCISPIGDTASVSGMILLSTHALSLVEGDLRRSLSTLSAVVRGALKNS